MHVFLTGGTGFIGSHLVEQLLTAGHRVSVLSSGSVPHANLQAVRERVHWHWGNFDNGVLMHEALAGVDVLVHLAWTTVPKDASDNPAYDVQSNVVGGLHLLDACVANRVGRVLFVSTGGAIYGTPQYTPIDEGHPLAPLSSYGISKSCFERYLHFYRINRGLQSLVFRVSNAYGPRQNLTKNQGVIGIWLQRLRQGLPLQIWGDGSVVRDYIYVDDVARALCLGINYQGKYQTFNLGYGKGYSLNELLRLFADALGFAPKVEYLPARSFDVPVNVLDNALICKELIWKPSVAPEQGILKMLDGYT